MPRQQNQKANLMARCRHISSSNCSVVETQQQIAATTTFGQHQQTRAANQLQQQNINITQKSFTERSQSKEVVEAAASRGVVIGGHGLKKHQKHQEQLLETSRRPNDRSIKLLFSILPYPAVFVWLLLRKSNNGSQKRRRRRRRSRRIKCCWQSNRIVVLFSQKKSLGFHGSESAEMFSKLSSSSFLLLLPLIMLLISFAPVGLPASANNITQPVTQQQQQQQQQTPTTSKPANYLETGRQITGILDKFLTLGYDKRVRPNYGGPPVEVNVTMRILSISSVSEVMMDFTADFYFRQTWHDPRLSFKKLGDIQTLYVGAEVSKKIWLPDTFFGNEKLAYFHEATTPNVFLRIDHSGEVYRSIRLTVTSSCPMNLQYFPMDRQRCTIEAESYGYNVKDIIYRWARKDTAVERDKEISLPQFDIVKTVQKYRLEELSSGTYSRLIAEIHFARRMGYYLIQIYIPSSLIVVISWVSFWLHRNASPARVQLGVTTVLTMTTLMSSTNAALPKISYVKSIDIFLGTCFIMVFAALLEYATVGYLGKRIAMRKAHVQHAQSQAQARVFAQLQAQGAQGDPVPPTTACSLALLNEPICGLGIGVGNNNNNNNNNNSSPTIFQQQQMSNHLPPTFQQRQQQQQQQIQSDPGGGGFVPHVPERNNISHSLCNCGSGGATNQHSSSTSTCQHQHHHSCCCCPVAAAAASNQHNGGTKASRLHKSVGLCHSCGGHQVPLANRNQLNFNASSTGGYGDLTAESADQTDEQAIMAAAAAMAAATAAAASAGQQPMMETANEKQPPHPIATNFSPNTGTGAGAGGHQQQLNSFQPPSYPSMMTNSNNTKGTSAAATAAAATFINMHRRNKGLPPSTNPNFSQFSWVGGQHNRSLETIFGIRPSDIDKYSRVVFPVCFVCFQLIYWIVYLHISAFLESEQQQQQMASN